MQFHYVYILEGKSEKEHYYVGCTQDLRSRLNLHNRGKIKSSQKNGPWRIKNAFGMRYSVNAWTVIFILNKEKQKAGCAGLPPVTSDLVALH